MKLNELLHNTLLDFLLEAERSHPKTSFDTYKQLQTLKRYGFDLSKDILQNQMANDYVARVYQIIYNHCKLLNIEIYNWLKQNYHFRKINWQESKTTISQYIHIILMNGKHTDIRISDHRGQLNDNSRINTLNIYYNTPFNDILKNKIKYFIETHSEKNKFQKIS